MIPLKIVEIPKLEPITYNISIFLIKTDIMTAGDFHLSIHPYPFKIKVLSESHSMGLATPGYVEHWLSMHPCLVGQRQLGHTHWHQSSHMIQDMARWLDDGSSDSVQTQKWTVLLKSSMKQKSNTSQHLQCPRKTFARHCDRRFPTDRQTFNEIVRHFDNWQRATSNEIFPLFIMHHLQI